MKMLFSSCSGSGVAALWGEPPGNLASVLLEVINIEYTAAITHYILSNTALANIEHTAAITHSVLPITY